MLWFVPSKRYTSEAAPHSPIALCQYECAMLRGCANSAKSALATSGGLCAVSDHCDSMRWSLNPAVRGCMHAVQLPMGVHPCPCQTTSSCARLSAGLEDRSDLVLSALSPGPVSCRCALVLPWARVASLSVSACYDLICIDGALPPWTGVLDRLPRCSCWGGVLPSEQPFLTQSVTARLTLHTQT